MASARRVSCRRRFHGVRRRCVGGNGRGVVPPTHRGVGRVVCVREERKIGEGGSVTQLFRRGTSKSSKTHGAQKHETKSTVVVSLVLRPALRFRLSAPPCRPVSGARPFLRPRAEALSLPRALSVRDHYAHLPASPSPSTARAPAPASLRGLLRSLGSHSAVSSPPLSTYVRLLLRPNCRLRTALCSAAAAASTSSCKSA